MNCSDPKTKIAYKYVHRYSYVELLKVMTATALISNKSFSYEMYYDNF